MATVQLNNNNSNKKDQDTCISDGWCYLHRIRETYDNVKYIYCKIVFPHTSNLAIEVDSNIFHHWYLFCTLFATGFMSIKIISVRGELNSFIFK